MEENKNLENDKQVPGMENENIEQAHEKRIEETITQIESKMTGLNNLEKEVGGDQGIKDTIAKISPEEKQEIVEKIKGVIDSHMKGVKTGAVLFAGMVLAVILEYLGIKSLDTSSIENFGHSMPDGFLASGVVLMGLTASPGVVGFGMVATKGIQALKERVKLWNFNRKNKE